MKLGKAGDEADLHLIVSTIAAGLVVEGSMKAEGDMRIDGKVIGNIQCSGKIIVGPQGIIEGDIEAGHADVFGSIRGNLSIKQLLCLKAGSRVNGNLLVGRLDIDPDAYLDGQCKMMGDNKDQLAITEAASVGT